MLQELELVYRSKVLEEKAFSMSKIHFIANDEVTILESNRNAKNDKKVQKDIVIEAKTLTRTPLGKKQ